MAKSLVFGHVGRGFTPRQAGRNPSTSLKGYPEHRRGVKARLAVLATNYQLPATSYQLGQCHRGCQDAESRDRLDTLLIENVPNRELVCRLACQMVDQHLAEQVLDR